MFATVRNRRGVISSVIPADGGKGRLHLVQLEYKDDQFPADEQLIWELEAYGSLLEPTALPVAGGTKIFMLELFIGSDRKKSNDRDDITHSAFRPCKAAIGFPGRFGEGGN